MGTVTALVVTDMTAEEVRLLRSYVRYELGRRQTQPSASGSIPIERVWHIRDLAKKFVEN